MLEIRQILCPIDFSEVSRHALDHARVFAGWYRARVTALHVRNPAFLQNPPLLFADEPTGSLDAATGEAVIQLMFELNRERGSTLVLVTHDPAMAARCGRTLTIAAGRLLT